jgi:NADH-quinone oxidoreductase subunit M
MFPEASVELAPLVFALSIVAIIYTSLVALAQEDMKKLIAYSSVAHMGYVTLGLFAIGVQAQSGEIMGQQAVTGAIFQMLSHGIVSAALFLCVGVVYDRMHTREIDRYGGLVQRMPKYAAVFMIMMLASVGLPGTSGFVGEFLVLLGAYQANTWLGVLASTGVILGATYMLWLYRRVIFGPLEKSDLKDILDMNRREILIFAPLVILVLWMGIYPSSFTEVMDASVVNLIENFKGGVCARDVGCFAAAGP